MKIQARGEVHPRVTVIGRPICPAYVIRGDGATMMIEAGVNFMGPLFKRDLDDIGGGSAAVDFLFVTHSHWDHLGSMPYLKREIPSVRVGAHRAVPPLLEKESAVRTMEFFSEFARQAYGMDAGDEVKIAPVPVEFHLEGGEEFDLGGVTCRVIATPGHTRDHLSYFFPEIGALFPGETIGVPEGRGGEAVQVEFLSSFDEYLHSIEMLRPLKPSIIGMAHEWVFTGDDALDYMERTAGETLRYRELIEGYLDSCDGDVERTIACMVSKEYDEKGTIYQERNAYIANLSAQVKHIASLRNH